MRKDIDLSFVAHPMTGDLATKKDSAAIRQSIRNIVLTSFYERGFNTEFGTNVRDMLFENISALEVQSLKDLITEGIQNYESQVEVYDIVVQYGSSENEIVATIMYTENNDPSEKSVSIELERLR